MYSIKEGIANVLDKHVYQTEEELQSILFHNPDIVKLIPELNLFQDSIVICCREFPLLCGKIDLLIITENADIILVETKLLRNPESSRTVIAQVIDYVKTIVNVSADDLIETAIKLKHSRFDTSKTIDGRFSAVLSNNLKKGNISVLIAGDEISQNLLGMVASIQSAPHLSFTIYLLSIKTFTDGTSIFILPEIISKTVEVERSVINIVFDIKDSKFQVESSVPEINGKGTKPKITWDAYIEKYTEKELVNIFTEFYKAWIQIDREGFTMGTVGFSAGVYSNGNRVPIQYAYDGYLDLLSDKFRRNYSIPDEIYNVYKEMIAKFPRIYDSKLISNKPRMVFTDYTYQEIRGVLNASLNIASLIKDAKHVV